MYARPYTTAAQVMAVRSAAALTIQRFTRGWLGLRRVQGLRAYKAERDAFVAEQEAAAQQAASDKRRSV